MPARKVEPTTPLRAQLAADVRRTALPVAERFAALGSRGAAQVQRELLDDLDAGRPVTLTYEVLDHALWEIGEHDAARSLDAARYRVAPDGTFKEAR